MATFGAGGLASLASIKSSHATEAPHAGERRVITYAVQGFTCITCAVGLETLLGKENGVLAAHADYAAATTRIEYDPAVVTDVKLRISIQDAGFRVSRMLA